MIFFFGQEKKKMDFDIEFTIQNKITSYPVLAWALMW